MKLSKLDTPIKTIEGVDIIAEGGKPFIVSAAIVSALTAPYQDEQHLSGEEKFKRGVLAQKVHASTDVELTIEEIADIKKVVGKAFAVPVVFFVFNFLEGKTNGDQT